MEEVLARYFSGESSEAEKKEVKEWRAASDENASLFLEYKQVWAESAESEEPDEVILESIFSMDSDQKPDILPLWRQSMLKYAAILLVAMGVLFVVYNLNQSEKVIIDGIAVNELTEYDLPDGSTVTLHSGSSISINDFKSTREVRLTGKAFFEVKRDESKPFIVSTQQAKVKVLGTSFLVNSAENSDGVEVMVRSGKVAFGQNEEIYGSKAITVNLEKGEMGVLKKDEKGIKKFQNLDPNYLAWKTRIITVKDQDMMRVAGLLEDVYDVDIQFENELIGNCHLTASFKEKSVEEIMDIIAETFGISYQIKNKNKITISGVGC